MKNEALAAALNVSVENDVLGVEDEEFLDVVDNLRDSSSEVTPDAVDNEVAEGEDDLLIVEKLAEALSTAPETDSVAMESIGLAFDVLLAKYSQPMIRHSMESLSADMRKVELVEKIGQFKTNMEAALVVSQESWAVRDLWDSIGMIERQATDLESAVRQLDSNKKWFSEHGIVINSLSQLRYLSVNEVMTTNLIKDTENTLHHAENLLAVARIASDSTAKIRDIVKGSKVATDDDALAMLKKVIGLPNPSVLAKAKLDNVYLLNNKHAVFNVIPIKNNNGMSIGDWEKVGTYSLDDLGRPVHGVKASMFLRIPGWLVGYITGSTAGGFGAGILGAGAAAGSLGFGIGIILGFVVSSGMSENKAGKQFKHNIKFDEVKSALDKTVALTRKAAQTRRELPGHFERMFTMRDEVKSLLSDQASNMGPNGKEALLAIKTIYTSAEKLSWNMNMWGFGLMRDIVSNSDTIARKMVKASK